MFKYLRAAGCKITGCENRFYKLSHEVLTALNIEADIYRDLAKIKDRKFDIIFATDVLEHIDNLDSVISKFLELSDDRTKFIISGPTENLLYRTGRMLIGYAGQDRFHERNIYDVENRLQHGSLRKLVTKNLYFPFTLFRIGSWQKRRCCTAI